MAAIAAAERHFAAIKRKEEEKHKPIKGRDRAEQKRKQTRITWLGRRKAERAIGYNSAKESLWKHMNNLCESKKMDEGGINIKQA